MITIFKNIHTTSTPFYKDVDVIINRIKNGSSKQLIEKIRKLKEKSERDILKKDLPSICFSGTFKTRSAENIIEHSGLICLDFDHFGNETIASEWRERLKNDKYTNILFTSPSGDGLKCVVKIPAEIENHKRYWDSLKEYYNTNYFDGVTSDICRVCYESYDPEIFYNKDSEIWTEKNEFQEYEYTDKKPILPVESSSIIIQKLQKWFDKNHSVIKGERNKNIFIFANALNDYGINEIEATNYLSQYQQKDFSIREIERIVSSAYSKRANHGTKYFEDIETKKAIHTQVRSGKDIKRIYSQFDQINPDVIDNVIDELKTTSTINEFWTFNSKGICKITNHKFKLFLEQHGFCKYYPEGSMNFIFIKIENSFIEYATPDHIKDFVLNYLLNKNELKPYEIMTSNTSFFKEDYLSLLKAEEIKLFEDEQDFAMLYYKNCAVKITPEGIEKIDYLNLNGMVWKHHVINRNFDITDFIGCVFDRFIGFVSGQDESRKNAIMSTMGYMMHSYKTSAKNKSIIFNDEAISENPNGGSGKGIIINAISKVKRVCILDGKLFDFSKTFPFQIVPADTQLLVFDDVKKRFNFEALFSLITEGITLEKKNKDAIKIPVNKSPKIIITTNYTIGGVGGSFERRKHEIELSSYFNVNHTPLDEFGLMLFDDFDQNEWQKFDNFMISCVQLFLKNGLIAHSYENLKTRKFIGDTSYEFFEWSAENLPLNKRLIKTEKYSKIIEDYPDLRRFLSQKKFAQWIDIYGMFLGKKVEHGNSNGQRWAEIHGGSDEIKKEIDCPF